uniref:Cystatin domain-containing protein n=1 Tax=Callithrix jacchus TaxID=9483 RepID=A0A8I3WRB8_CALJA
FILDSPPENRPCTGTCWVLSLSSPSLAGCVLEGREASWHSGARRPLGLLGSPSLAGPRTPATSSPAPAPGRGGAPRASGGAAQVGKNGAALGSALTTRTTTPTALTAMVQKAAQAAVAHYNMGSNSVYYFRDTHILKAQSQLVAGIKYFLTVEMGSTNCRKTRVAGDHLDLTTCPLSAGAQQEKLRCDFEVLVVPWQNSSQLLKHTCVEM